MKQVTVTKDPSVNDGMGYAEIGQSQHTKQALLVREGDLKFRRITGFVLCRDFLVDTYSFAKENKDFGIYGFSFKGSKMQPDWNSCNIMMKFDSPASRENFLTHVEQILHKIEKQNKIDPTVIFSIAGDDNNLVVVGDVKWLQNCLTFSLYSLLLRCMCYKYDGSKDWITVFSKMHSSDSKYIASVPRKTLDKVLADLSLIETKTFCGFDPKKHGTGTIHHNSGFISVFGSHTEISEDTVRENQHWQTLTKAGLESHTEAA